MADTVVDDIKTLRIQGAECIAVAAANAIGSAAHLVATGNRDLGSIFTLREDLTKARATEPALRNTLSYIFRNHDPNSTANKPEIVSDIQERAAKAARHFEEGKEKIILYGEKKIKSGMIIFTHCHSSTVVETLIKAKRNGKTFRVHNTETRPFYQGRTTATELSAAGIPVTHYVDSAARLALKRADLMLIGCDALTSEGKVINKIGTELFAEVASRYQVPVYCCTNSWKLDPQTVFGYEETIECRPASEVWPNAPVGVTVDNHAFEKVDPAFITGIISELGVYSSPLFVEQVRKNYPEFF